MACFDGSCDTVEESILIEAERIADVLGGEKVLKRDIRSLAELAAMVKHGLPKSALRVVLSHLQSDSHTTSQLMDRLVPKATYKRRKSVLSPAESERIERLARVIATAEYIWDDSEAARQFLQTPHPLLEQQTPCGAAMTEFGARQVEEILWKIFYGLPA
jgi:putative toxin-antitoxin system antitoxin component (TIGR02293 family)